MSHPRARRAASLLAALALLASSIASPPASAQVITLPLPTTFTVINNDDSDTGACTETHCTLREAINAANFVPFCLVGQVCRNTINFQFGLAQPLTVTVTSALPQITGSVVIDGNNLPIEDVVTLPNGTKTTILIPHPGHVQVIGSGLASNVDGLVLAHGASAAGTIINNLQVTNFTGAGIHATRTGNTIVNSTISNNTGNGVSLDTGSNTVRNSTITNNHLDGVGASSASGNGVFGSTITSNSRNGVSGGSGLTVGSTSTSDRNIISGNAQCGLSGSMTIIGNYIGVDATGATAQPNGQAGVCAFTGGITVGGSAPGAGNVISGNGSHTDPSDFRGHGIVVDASVGDSPSLIQGNLIGTNAADTAAVANGKDGIRVIGNSLGNPSDGLVPAVSILNNVVSGNGSNGIAVFDGFKHVIQSNFIGTDATNTLSLPNGFNGIFIDDARSVTVGMPLSGGTSSQANVIAHNFESGVTVFTETAGSVNSVGNTVRGNSISSNTRTAIDLVQVKSQIGFGVVDQPVPVHPDNGPNRFQNMPQLTAAVRTTSNGADVLVVAGNMFTNLAAGNLLVDVYANTTCDTSGFGEAQQFLGTVGASPVAVTVGGALTGFAAFQAAIPTSPRLADGTAISATVTSSARGDTSEMSKCLVVDNGTGVPKLSPSSASTGSEQEVAFTYSWTVPAPHPWRSLSDMELRLRDPNSNDVPVLLRWDETPNTFALFNASSGKFGPAGLPGSDQTLANHGVRIDLAHASVVGSGPTGQSVTLTIPVTLNAQFVGRTYVVEAAATDDSGQRADFAPVGTLQVN